MTAFLFDLNGTLIDDMDCHTRAWLQLLNNQLGGNFSYEQVKREMYGKNSEALQRFFGSRSFTAAEVKEVSEEKERRYRECFSPRMKLLPGLAEFLAKAHSKGIKMAIASAAIPANIDFILDGLAIRDYFGAIVTAEDVVASKPHPETFLKAATLLNEKPQDCLVFEDAPKGAEAARNAGMNAIILTTGHEPRGFSHLENILAFWPDYTTNYEQIFNH